MTSSERRCIDGNDQRRRRSQERRRQDRRRQEGARNNFLSPYQRAVARRTYERRLDLYHGPDWRETGMTGIYVEQLINALPQDIVDVLRADAYGGFARDAPRWSLRALVENAAPFELLDHNLSARTAMRTPYASRFQRGTLYIERAGAPFAQVVLETEEAWAAAQATHNPSGRIDEAPPGALKILCVCTFGLQTGVELRIRTEIVLRRLGVDAWLELAGKADVPARLPYADAVLLTVDEQPDSLAWHGPTLIVLGNDCSPADIKRELTRLLATRAGRSDKSTERCAH